MVLNQDWDLKTTDTKIEEMNQPQDNDDDTNGTPAGDSSGVAGVSSPRNTKSGHKRGQKVKIVMQQPNLYANSN